MSAEINAGTTHAGLMVYELQNHVDVDHHFHTADTTVLENSKRTFPSCPTHFRTTSRRRVLTHMRARFSHTVLEVMFLETAA